VTGLVAATVLAALAIAWVLWPALAPPRAAPAGSAAVSDADLESVIGRYRTAHRDCPSCGPRPESDAMYCSRCGRYLALACRWCGAEVKDADARACGACGRELGGAS
jgi:hypothetical protein